MKILRVVLAVLAIVAADPAAAWGDLGSQGTIRSRALETFALGKREPTICRTSQRARPGPHLAQHGL